MDLFVKVLSLVVIGFLLYLFINPFFCNRCTKKQEVLKVEEVVVPKPAPKKRRAYKKRKPKSVTTEEKSL